MHVLFAICALVVFATASEHFQSQKYYNIENKFAHSETSTGQFTTLLDHFRPQNDTRVDFAYTAKIDYYRAGGPLFFYINDADIYTTEWLEAGLIHDIAKDMQGALLTTSHRYFGDNIPTKSASLDNLHYLTFEQSLADIAYFIQAIKDELDVKAAKVFLWGSGYGGTLAAMARQKFPHLVDAAWSTSGIFSYAPYTVETHRHLSEIIRSVGGDHCANHLKKTFDEMQDLIYNNEGELLQNALNLCDPVNTKSDLNVASFFESQIRFISDYFGKYHYSGIQNFCNDLLVSNIDFLYSFGRWTKYVYGNSKCFNVSYQDKVNLGRNEEWNQPGTNSGLRQWYYYKCSQLGLWETSAYDGTLFGNNIRESYYYYICKDFFGDSFNYEMLYESIEAFNIQYGGLSQETTKVIFSNGYLDPWNYHGLRTLVNNNESVVINIPSYARSADLTSITDKDSVALDEAKHEIKRLILEWIIEDFSP